MNKSFFKFLTFIYLATLCSLNVSAAVISQSELKDYLRWKINVSKDQIQITKKGNKVTFKTLDAVFFEQLAADVTKFKKNNSYHQQFTFEKPKKVGDPYTLTLSLKDSSVELFSFYKTDQKSYILDYWIDQDSIDFKSSAVAKKTKKIKIAKKVTAPIIKKKSKQQKTVGQTLDIKKNKKIINPNSIQMQKKKLARRDFRYGAAFIWNYDPIIPSLESDINLRVKAPDYLYEVKDRKMLHDKHEAHMQLTINFYRKEQWGLMTRSIRLYEEKYGDDRNKTLNTFMKAASLIKNVIKSKVDPSFIDENGEKKADYSKKGVLASARNMLTNILDRSRDYSLNQAILRYLIQHTRNENDHISALTYAKNLYIKASEQFDDEMTAYSSRVILNSLAHLRQLDKMKEFLTNKAAMRVLSKQEGFAYMSYINLINDNPKMVISNFMTQVKSLAKPVHEAILFNTAEAYFREAKYTESNKLFDEFLANYSFTTVSGQARLRISLGYDLMNKDEKVIERLYKDAINKTSDLATRFEAKLRYVAFKAIRKPNLLEEDLEVISFINATEGEKRVITKEHKKLLWLVRLRSLINTKKYADALAYLTTLPLDSISNLDKRVFEADGAEIVLGVIQSAYFKEDYTSVIKTWEVYKEKYEAKVAKNPYLNFIVADSFLKLNLVKSYERSVTYLEKLQNKNSRSFPLWVESHKKLNVSDLLLELQINNLVKSGSYGELKTLLAKNKSNKMINYNYYNGVVSNKLKNYTSSVQSFESVLVTPNNNNSLTPEQSLTMFETYLDSLFNSASSERFRKNAAALINDLRRSNNPKARSILAGAEYKYIESLFAEQKTDYKILKMKTAEFIKEHDKSLYKTRVEYIYGVALINNNLVKEGKEVLSKLLSDTGVSDYLKGLARSKLSDLILKEKTI